MAKKKARADAIQARKDEEARKIREEKEKLEAEKAKKAAEDLAKAQAAKVGGTCFRVSCTAKYEGQPYKHRL